MDIVDRTCDRSNEQGAKVIVREKRCGVPPPSDPCEPWEHIYACTNWDSTKACSSFKMSMRASTSASAAAPAHNAPLPPTASSAGKSSRIAPHSHIKGLGLTQEGFANVDGAGFIGQTNAREVRLTSSTDLMVLTSGWYRHAAWS